MVFIDFGRYLGRCRVVGEETFFFGSWFKVVLLDFFSYWLRFLELSVCLLFVIERFFFCIGFLGVFNLNFKELNKVVFRV